MPTKVLARVVRRGIDPRIVRARANRMLVKIGEGDAELSLLLTTDREITKLNEEYRGKRGPTDVLAFQAGRDLAGDRLLGDVVISLDTAGTQARARGVAPLDEVTFLLAHGLLHLTGFDHRTNSEERKMNAATRSLVRAAVRTQPRARRKRSRPKPPRSK